MSACDSDKESGCGGNCTCGEPSIEAQIEAEYREMEKRINGQEVVRRNLEVLVSLVKVTEHFEDEQRKEIMGAIHGKIIAHLDKLKEQ